MSQKNLNSKEINTYIGKKIIQARREEGVMQQELADYLGISRIAMSSYETGRTRIGIPNLAILSKALGKSIEYFIEDIFEKSQKIKQVKVENFNTNESIKFSLEMSLRNYLGYLGFNKKNLDKKTKELLLKIDHESSGD
jgi:transcriptional regulator with XRE-family HTH domain